MALGCCQKRKCPAALCVLSWWPVHRVSTICGRRCKKFHALERIEKTAPLPPRTGKAKAQMGVSGTVLLPYQISIPYLLRRFADSGRDLGQMPLK